jgi:hypothetical protein
MRTCQLNESGLSFLFSNIRLKGRHFGLDGLRQKRSRVAQCLGQRMRKCSWWGNLEDVNIGPGVSRLQWRSGDFEHPDDTPPYPLMPSPTFAHYALLVRLAHE